MPPTDTQIRPTQNPSASFRNLWHNGWGARLVLIGCALSFVALWEPWGANVTGYIVNQGGTAAGGNAFETSLFAALFWLGLLALSVFCCARPRSGSGSLLRWAPLACAVVLAVNVVGLQLASGREEESREAARAQQGRTSPTITPGDGPNWFVIGQLIAGLGAIGFAMRKPVPQGPGEGIGPA